MPADSPYSTKEVRDKFAGKYNINEGMAQPEEKELILKIRNVYNSGDGARAVELACKYLSQFPSSPHAKYNFAVMHGDYSYSPRHSAEEKLRLLEIAKQGTAELLNDPAFNTWDKTFCDSVRNEFYWFHEMPDKQFELGIERLNRGENGHYSACVGASMMALNELKAGRINESEDWAHKSLYHFSEFEKIDPSWYNINFFASQSLACLGKFEEALECFENMYLKQKSTLNEAELAEFKARIELIKGLRS